MEMGESAEGMVVVKVISESVPYGLADEIRYRY